MRANCLRGYPEEVEKEKVQFFRAHGERQGVARHDCIKPINKGVNCIRPLFRRSRVSRVSRAAELLTYLDPTSEMETKFPSAPPKTWMAHT
jgi:hypothetical protein